MSGVTGASGTAGELILLSTDVYLLLQGCQAVSCNRLELIRLMPTVKPHLGVSTDAGAPPHLLAGRHPVAHIAKRSRATSCLLCTVSTSQYHPAVSHLTVHLQCQQMHNADALCFWSPTVRLKRLNLNHGRLFPAAQLVVFMAMPPADTRVLHQYRGLCRASVRAAKAFGLFVELQGHRRQGLVHSTAISTDVSFSKDDDEASRAKALDFLYPPGTDVWIKVIKVDEAQQKFGCSMLVRPLLQGLHSEQPASDNRLHIQLLTVDRLQQHITAALHDSTSVMAYSMVHSHVCCCPQVDSNVSSTSTISMLVSRLSVTPYSSYSIMYPSNPDLPAVPSRATHRPHARTMQAVSQETGQDLDPSNRQQMDGPRGAQKEGAPEQGAVLASKVHTVKPFGIFVQMEGWRTNGLVHVRQVLALVVLLAAAQLVSAAAVACN